MALSPLAESPPALSGKSPWHPFLFPSPGGQALAVDGGETISLLPVLTPESHMLCYRETLGRDRPLFTGPGGSRLRVKLREA